MGALREQCSGSEGGALREQCGGSEGGALREQRGGDGSVSANRGDDDLRRTFQPPRQGLQLCVAPYFATRGRGDMRGRCDGHHISRTPEAVRGCRVHHGMYRAVCQCYV